MCMHGHIKCVGQLRSLDASLKGASLSMDPAFDELSLAPLKGMLQTMNHSDLVMANARARTVEIARARQV